MSEPFAVQTPYNFQDPAAKPDAVPPPPFLNNTTGDTANIPPAPAKPGEIPMPPLPGIHPSPWTY